MKTKLSLNDITIESFEEVQDHEMNTISGGGSLCEFFYYIDPYRRERERLEEEKRRRAERTDFFTVWDDMKGSGELIDPVGDFIMWLPFPY